MGTAPVMAAETRKAALTGHSVPPLKQQFRLNDSTHASFSDTLTRRDVREDIEILMHERVDLTRQRIDKEQEADLRQEKIV